jgi:hypothetical protein
MIDNCYKCQHRRDVPGDTHSQCVHPLIGHGMVASILAMQNPPKDLNIKGNPHGIKKGWFFWPMNFDPVWLENCDGFTPRGN